MNPPFLRTHIFPAGHGDCIWIEYGEGDERHNILVDAGTAATGKRLVRYIQDAFGGKVHFDVLVITHVDADHIGGVFPILTSDVIEVSVGDVWFNGYRHLIPGQVEVMGPLQGEKLTQLILAKRLSWNGAFRGGAVRLDAGDGTVAVQLAQGALATIVSADAAQLGRLEKVWAKVCSAAGLLAGRPADATAQPAGLEAMGPIDVEALASLRFTEDSAPANGSSIAMLIEFAGDRLVLLGDAYPSIVLKGLRARHGSRRISAGLVKLPHHGSRSNVSHDLVRAFDARNWVFSTSGAIFQHPDREAVARVVASAVRPNLVFNYRTKFNRDWDDAALRERYGFTTQFGNGRVPVTIELLAHA